MNAALGCLGGLVAASVLSTQCLNAAASVDRIYFVGNSMTEQQFYGAVMLNEVGTLAGSTATCGLHTHGGVGLSTIVWAWTVNGFASYVDPSGYTSALATGTWNKVVLEPWQNSANAEVAAARQILSSHPNPATPAYIYAVFPSRINAAGQYDASAPPSVVAQWNAPYTNFAANVGDTRNAAYFARIFSQLRIQEPARPFFMIPVGDVFAEIESQINTGQITGVEMTDFYADAIHGTLLARYVVALTQACVLFKQDVRNKPLPVFFQPHVPAALAPRLQSIVWDVVSARAATTGVFAPCGQSDVAGLNQSVGPDSELTADDIVVYLSWYFARDARANVAGPNQSALPDDDLSPDDIIVFLGRYFAGCS